MQARKPGGLELYAFRNVNKKYLLIKMIVRIGKIAKIFVLYVRLVMVTICYLRMVCIERTSNRLDTGNLIRVIFLNF